MIARTLQQAGHKALLAGGCVRDLILGSNPDDYDVATSATPAQIQKLFKKVLMIGEQFGVAMVIYKGRVTEVATFRSDLSYSDGRRPDAIKYCDAEEDALRRDFTINGMFMDPLTEKIIDYVGGRDDIRNKIIRAIGDAKLRFSEDYLRMMRAVRFAARLDFELDSETAAAIVENAQNLSNISGERIREELEKMLASAASRQQSMELLNVLGLRTAVFGAALEDDSAWQAAIDRVANLPASANATAAMCCIYAEASKGEIKKIARRWGASNATAAAMTDSTQMLDKWRQITNGEMPLHQFKKILSMHSWPIISQLWRAEIIRCDASTAAYDEITRRIKQIDPEQIAPKAFVNGADLIDMGIKPGPRMGKILKKIYDMQLDEVFDNRLQAIAAAKEMIAQDE